MYRAIQLNKVVLIVGVAILGLLMVSAAQATIISQHVGSTDPSTEGFAVSGSPNGSADAGPPANWKMVTAASTQGFYTETLTAADFTDPSGWTWTMQSLGGAPYNTYTKGKYQAMTRIGDSLNRVAIEMLIDGGPNGPGVYIFSGTDYTLQFGTVDPGAAWHTYQIYMNPHDAGTADDVFEMYLDGDAAGTFTRADVASYTSSLFQFGKLSAANTPAVTQQYAIQRLETGNQVIPEPSSIVLLAFGLIGLLCYAWRKRK